MPMFSATREVEHADAEVDVDIGHAGESDAEHRIAADQYQSVLVLAKAHLCGHVLAGEPFQQAGNIVLGLRQEKK